MKLIAKRPNARNRMRDHQLQRMQRRLQLLAPHLDSPVFSPTIRGFCQVSLLLERSYATLRGDESLISTETGELRASVDTVRRLAQTQSQLARELNLTPSTMRAFSKEKPILDLDDDDPEEEKAAIN